MFFKRRAIKKLREAAENGDPRAQGNLAMMYYEGTNVRQDQAEAAKWFRRVADQGAPEAQNWMGVLYETGTGVPQDYTEAVTWYRRAAEQGFAHAYAGLGTMYNKGWGVQRDFIEAAKWLTRALEEGQLAQVDPDAGAEVQFELGKMYLNGLGVALDFVEARRWLTQAAEQGHQEAQHNLELLENSEESLPGETMGDLLLQRDTLQHISFGLGFASARAGPSAAKEVDIRIIDTKVLEPPRDPTEGWVEQWTVSYDGEQADHRVEYKSDGSGGYLISSSILK